MLRKARLSLCYSICFLNFFLEILVLGGIQGLIKQRLNSLQGCGGANKMQTDAIWPFFHFFFFLELRLWAVSFAFPFQEVECSSGSVALGSKWWLPRPRCSVLSIRHLQD